MKQILQDGEPVLRGVAASVSEVQFVNGEVTSWIDMMDEALGKEPDGVALAAPQIGIPYRLFIVRYDRMLPPREDGQPRKKDLGVFINPEIIRTSRRRDEFDEGCLSTRGIYGKTYRFERATVRAKDARGKIFERGGGGIISQAYQHEIDHLNGILYIDHAHGLYTPVEHRIPPFVFFGTPYVAADTLTILKERGYVPSLIVTAPDTRSGRGMEVKPSATKTWALEESIPVITPEKLNAEVREEIAHTEAAFAIVVAYGKIFPQSLLDLFPKGVLNVHYSLLPKYRGASPVEAAFLHGDSETGVAVQKMVKELDAGDVLALERVAIHPKETTRELRPRLIKIGAELLADILPAYLEDALTPMPQDASQATRAGKISKEAGLLNLGDDANTNWNKYRAYAESPGTYFFMERDGVQMRVKIKTANYENGVFMPLRVVPEGKKEMDYADLVRSP